MKYTITLTKEEFDLLIQCQRYLANVHTVEGEKKIIKAIVKKLENAAKVKK